MAKRGRPKKPAAERKLAPIGVRLTPDLRGRLEGAQRKSGRRSLAEEIEFRLRESFGPRQRIRDAFGGATTCALLHRVAVAMRIVESQTGRRWWEDRFTHQECVEAISAIMEIMRPAGRTSASKRAKGIRQLGRRAGEAALHAIEMAVLKTHVGDTDFDALGDEVFADFPNLARRMNRAVSVLSGPEDMKRVAEMMLLFGSAYEGAVSDSSWKELEGWVERPPTRQGARRVTGRTVKAGEP